MKRNSFYIFILLIFYVMLFNYIMNPFAILYKDVFPQRHPYSWKHQFDYYNIKLRLDKNKYKYAIVGGSPVSKCFWFLPSNEYFTLWAYVTNIKFLHSVLIDFLDLQPNIKEIYFGLDVSLFINRNASTGNYDKNITFKDVFNLFYSYETTKWSVKQLSANIKDSLSSKNRTLTLPWEHPGYTEIKLIDEYFDELYKIQELCSKKGIKVKFFVTPYHALLLSKFAETGEYSNYEKFKREIAKRVDFIDFSYVNEYTSIKFATKDGYSDKILFYDIEHPFVGIGHLMIKKIKGEDIAFGIDVNSSNVEKVLQYERKVLNDYIKKNQDYIKEYLSHSQDEKSLPVYLYENKKAGQKGIQFAVK